MSSNPMKEFGQIARTRRMELGFSLESVAKEVLGNGDRKGYISELERGLLTSVPAVVIEGISKMLDLNELAVDAIFAPAVKKPVIVKDGIIKAQRVDLTVLPVSGKLKKLEDEGDQNRLDISHYGLPGPNTLESPTFPRGPCGHLSELLVPTTNQEQSPLVVYATTSNGGSTESDLYKFGVKLGKITCENPHIKLIEAPFLGTGKGGLKIYAAVRALAGGFISSRHPHSVLRLRNFTDSNVEEAKRAILDLAD